MYIHYGETQQPYKREIKNCPNLILYTLLELLFFILRMRRRIRLALIYTFYNVFTLFMIFSSKLTCSSWRQTTSSNHTPLMNRNWWPYIFRWQSVNFISTLHYVACVWINLNKLLVSLNSFRLDFFEALLSSMWHHQAQGKANIFRSDFAPRMFHSHRFSSTSTHQTSNKPPLSQNVNIFPIGVTVFEI